MNIAALLTKTARRFAERPAVALADTPGLTYGALAHRAAQLAETLQRRFGLRPGDRVALTMKNCPAYIETLYGVWYAGLTAVPVNAKLHPREFAYILDHCAARLCFATSDLVDTVAPLVAEIDTLEHVFAVGDSDYNALFGDDTMPPQDVDPNDVAWLFYTSGTTGQPKGAMLTHRNLLLMTLSYFADIETISPADTIIHAAPISHGSGLYGLPHVAKGAKQFANQVTRSRVRVATPAEADESRRDREKR